MAKPAESLLRSRRVPATFERNAWTERLRQRRAAGARFLDLTETDPIRLGFADAPALSRCLRRAADEPHAAYHEPDPRGILPARQAVSAYLAGRGTKVDPSHIVLTSGTSEAYAHLFRLLAEPGETVLVPAPSYPLFEPIASLAGIETASYRISYDGAWHLDVASVEAAFRAAPSARAVVVVQPNHPTGSCLDAAEIAALEQACLRHDAALISDEVFGDYPWPLAGDKDAAPSPLPSLLGARRVPTFVLGGLSKCCGLPQLKLGWIAACGPEEATHELLEGLEWISDLFLSVATGVQLALPDLFELRHAFQRKVRARIAENLATIRELVRAKGSELDLMPGQGGWAAILALPARHKGEEWALSLLDREVVVHPGEFYDLERSSVVLSLIVEPGTLRDALARVADQVRAS